ncbi:HAMP domain-containing sensor histidine kinase [Lapillicoccus sp.]|uniref:sensor histidine kinase n=1 Tax=Lapillicoccus sp. TaxID=1909287 RepID=UPI00326334F5
MRRLIVRTTLYAVLVAALVVAVPALAALVWVVTSRPALVTMWMAQPAGTRAFQLCVTATVLVAVAVAVTLGLVHGRAQRIAEPMTRLAEAAERLGQGPARLEPLASGIPEVDGVSAVLSRSAQQVTRSLSAERQFAADASHQLRTPLTALLMRLEEISESADLDVVHEEAGIAINQVERLTRVVDDLSMRSRRSNDAPRPEVSLDSVIAALQREWQPAFEQARRSVRVHGERGLVVRATPVALSQVLSTLLENSLVHGRGTVDLEARRSGPSVVVEVSDQGDGVSPTIAPHIFERSVSSGEGKSTGLGLALARDLAESNGGRLDLVSAQPVRFALFLSEADPR